MSVPDKAVAVSAFDASILVADQDRWFLLNRRCQTPALQLFCFPFAGGSAATYQRWTHSLPKNIEVLAVELPGHGRRFKEPSFVSLSELIGAVADPLRERLRCPFAFFGHSMGATIGFELARYLRRKYALEPSHLFLSARRGPGFPDDRAPIHNLPDSEFLEEIRNLDGTPAEILERPEVMRFLSPMLRADFQVIETYQYQPEPPLSCPITALGGLDDPRVSIESLLAWSRETSAGFKLKMLPGNHFFLRNSESRLLRLLKETLSAII
jgi:medium-chain acyl-[acyl-carrier-protein] hydrolase